MAEDFTKFQSFAVADNKQCTPISDDAAVARHLRELKQRKGVVHLVGMMDRPGAKAFMHALEYTYFPPNTKRNTEFEMLVVRWMDMFWFIITIPKKCEKFAHRSAERTGMVLRYDRIPLVLADSNEYPFPFVTDTDNMFMLENAPDSPVYKPGGAIALAQSEREVVRKIINPERN